MRQTRHRVRPYDPFYFLHLTGGIPRASHCAFFLQKITGCAGGIFGAGMQMIWLRQGRRTKTSALRRSSNRKGLERFLRPILLCRYAALPQKMEKEKRKCLRRTTASMFPRPARPWTSLRWRLPARLVYPHHLRKETNSN